MEEVIILLFFAGVFKCLADLSEESKLSWGSWWDKNLSWYNKYYAWFPLSKTSLVFLTDGWHLLQFLHTGCYQAAVSILLTEYYSLEWWKGLILFIIIKASVGAVGELTRKILH